MISLDSSASGDGTLQGGSLLDGAPVQDDTVIAWTTAPQRPSPALEDDAPRPEVVSVTDPPFSSTRYMCLKDKYETDIDTSPHAFSQHRLRTWPFPAPALALTGETAKLAAIYDAVRSTGLPNCLGARVPLPTALNLNAWARYIDKNSDEVDLYDYVRFGFPMG